MNLHSVSSLLLQTVVLLLFVGIGLSFPHHGSHEHKVLKSVKRQRLSSSSSPSTIVAAAAANSSHSSHSIRKRSAATHYFGPDPLGRNVLWWRDWWNQYVSTGPGGPAPLVSSPTSLSPSLLSQPTSVVLFDEPLQGSPDESEVSPLVCAVAHCLTRTRTPTGLPIR